MVTAPHGCLWCGLGRVCHSHIVLDNADNMQVARQTNVFRNQLQQSTRDCITGESHSFQMRHCAALHGGIQTGTSAIISLVSLWETQFLKSHNDLRDVLCVCHMPQQHAIHILPYTTLSPAQQPTLSISQLQMNVPRSVIACTYSFHRAVTILLSVVT